MPKTFTYNKTEKLKSKKQLDFLFANGKSFLVFPLKVFYNFTEKQDVNNINLGVGVSKRNFKKATDRNRIKRLIREAYRLNKISLHQNVTNKQLHFFILFIDKTMPEKRMHLDDKMIKILDKLNTIYNNELVV
ncbi:MAG: ribonuclease P protein component [Bacteroidetes bacterium]|nr:ribonuclease P protein component [Bacteroidota bacterium]